MTGTWLVSRPAPIGTVDEVYPNEQAATERETALRLGGCQRVVAWFCAESVGPWVSEAAHTSLLAALTACEVENEPEGHYGIRSPQNGSYGFDDWTRRLIEAANEGMSA